MLSRGGRASRGRLATTNRRTRGDPRFQGNESRKLVSHNRALPQTHGPTLFALRRLPKTLVAQAALLLAAVIVGPEYQAAAAGLDDAQKLYREGKYEEAEALADDQVKRGIWNERWPRLLIQCQIERGRYAEAKASYDAAIKRYPTSLTLRMFGLDILRLSNLPKEAEEAKQQIFRLLQSSPSRFASRDNLVAAGRYFAMQREDARQILELFYDRVRDADPQHLEAYVATAELALSKGDFKVAADTLQQAQRIDDSDPRIHYWLARAWESSDSSKAGESLERALEINPNHIPSLLYTADTAIDREQYDAAEQILAQIRSINPRHQEAFALLAVIAHLRGDYEKEVSLRSSALETWGNNPQVDHLIGLKLSQKYRFEEGAEYQRKALLFDPRYAPANFQLAQDLLRLGDEKVGWQLAEEIAEEDKYNVVAHNLMTLYDRIKGFSVLEAEGIQLRMEAHEARIYGDAALALLTEAKNVLCEKYEVQPRAPIVVEIFPEQKDFAIRTFGLPGGAGYLGVCFGRVITANSPASQGDRPSNWRSVLWHEFCHVVTLEKTKNRMPRWLSEGISVYEERQRDPSWGESMTPVYREMILGEALTPVSDLSAAFLNPESPIHLQFAYYESSLVIEFLIDRYGIDALKTILDDLGGGLTINDALTRSVGSLQKLDSQFETFARAHAQEFGAKADWSRDEMPEQPTPQELVSWVKEHPNNYWGLRALSSAYVKAKRFDLAKGPLEKLKSYNAMTGERGDPLEMLARVYHELDQLEAERDTLEEIVSLSSDALPALRRLIELASEEENWDLISDYAARVNAINPLLPEGHMALARAAEKSSRPIKALESLGALAQMDPVDPASLDYRMAVALTQIEQFDRAKHHVLRALDEAPRYRDAHRLLLKLSQRESEGEGESESEEKTKADDETTIDQQAESQ